MQPRVTVTISNWAMAGWAVEKECSEASKWGGGGPLWPGANPLCPPVGEPFSARPGARNVWEDWLVPACLLSVGAQVSGSGDNWQGWDLLIVLRARSGTCGSGRGLLGEIAFWGPAENQFGKHFQH